MTAQMTISVTQNIGLAVKLAAPASVLRAGDVPTAACCQYVFCAITGPADVAAGPAVGPQLKIVRQFGQLG